MPVRDDDRRTADVTPAEQAPLEAPERIGPYRLLEKLGEGGMGVVFLAEQKDPVWRRVAIKIVKLGMDTREIIARFDAERQALALMDHPGIARVYEAGATDSGRPYFVMELVRGQPITTYCDGKNLSTDERLELFVQVCDAIQHAHQKGVIHRDIKPGNILITEQSGKPEAKIIDFGVAKALDHRLTEHTLFTQHGQLIGTPEYMSPEQATTTGAGIDTRTDVYSLGVVFYELLTGALPFDPTSLREAALGEIRRIIQEETPPKPSTRLSTLGDESGRIASHRRTSLHGLERELRGDLDWIALKAMEKECARRYPSASELAADIRRHIKHEPVSAGPPSVSYQLRKFMRRHQGLTVGVFAVFAVLVLGLAGTLWQANVAQRQRAEAQREAATAEATLAFVQSMLKNDLEEAESGEASLVDRLNAASAAAPRLLAGQPAVEGHVRLVLADAYISLALFEEAHEHAQRALPLIEEAFGADSPEMAECLRVLGEASKNLGQLEEAANAYERAIAIWSNDGSHTLKIARCRSNLGVVRENQGELDEAETLYRQSLLTADPDRGDDALRQTLLARVLMERAEYVEAEELLRASLETMREIYQPNDVRLTVALDRLSVLLQRTDRLEEAAALAREAVDIKRQASVVQGDYRLLAPSLANMANIERALGNFAAAEALLTEAIPLYLQAFDENHEYVARMIMLLGVTQDAAGDHASAIATIEDAMGRYRESLGEEHWQYANARSQYGFALMHAGRTEDAERELLAAHARLAEAGMPVRAATAAGRLAALYEQIGDEAEAERWSSIAEGEAS